MAPTLTPTNRAMTSGVRTARSGGANWKTALSTMPSTPTPTKAMATASPPVRGMGR